MSGVQQSDYVRGTAIYVRGIAVYVQLQFDSKVWLRKFLSGKYDRFPSTAIAWCYVISFR